MHLMKRLIQILKEAPGISSEMAKAHLHLPTAQKKIFTGVFTEADANAEFQFKKLNGMKPKNVETGYRLQLGPISSNSFTAKSIVDAGNGNHGFNHIYFY